MTVTRPQSMMQFQSLRLNLSLPTTHRLIAKLPRYRQTLRFTRMKRYRLLTMRSMLLTELSASRSRRRLTAMQPQSRLQEKHWNTSRLITARLKPLRVRFLPIQAFTLQKVGRIFRISLKRSLKVLTLLSRAELMLLLRI